MRLQENDSDSCSNSCGISNSHLEKKESVENTMANGVNHRNQINDQRKDMKVTINEINQNLNVKNAKEKHKSNLNGFKNEIDIIPASTSSNGDATSEDIFNNNLNRIDLDSQNVSNGFSHNTHNEENAEATRPNGVMSSFSNGKTEENTISSSNGVRQNIFNTQASSNGVAHCISSLKEENFEVIQASSSNNSIQDASLGLKRLNGVAKGFSNGVRQNSDNTQVSSNGVAHGISSLEQDKCFIKQASSSNNALEGASVRPKRPNGVAQGSSNGVKQNNYNTQASSNGVAHGNALKDASTRSKRLNGIAQGSSNGVSHNFLSNEPETSYKLMQSNCPDNFSRPNNSKNKKKRKGKLHVSNNSCSVQSTMNDIDKTTIPRSDSKKELSGQFSALSVSDAAPIEGAVKINETTMDSNISKAQLNSRNNPLFLATNSYSEFIAAFDKGEKEKNAMYSEDHTPESGISSEGLHNSTESLRVEVDNLEYNSELGATGGHSLPGSPDNAYSDSLKSNDSGRGRSGLDCNVDPYSMVFQTEWPFGECGTLIGRKGCFVNRIKRETNATVFITDIPCEENKLVSIMGQEHEINAALQLIRERFPLNLYPEVTLEEKVRPPMYCPPSLKLSLPTEGTFEVSVCATVTAGHFFIQLPTHPCFHELHSLIQTMSANYNQNHTPGLTTVIPGNIVAVEAPKDYWCRAEVVEIYPEQEACQVRYLDLGGYQVQPIVNLRQIHMEYMKLPFQAIECYLAGVTCHEEVGWNDESKAAFEGLVRWKILSAYVSGVAEDGTFCLCLYHVNGATHTFINQALVEAGFLKYLPNNDE